MRKPWPLNFLDRLLRQAPEPQFNGSTGAVRTALQNPRHVAPTESESLRHNSAESLEELGKSAEDGDATAQNSLGVMLGSGSGALRGDPEARKWFLRAAEQGEAAAQFNLGNLCHTASVEHLAVGVREARIEAYMWFHLAAAQGHRAAQASCEMLNLQLTDDELEEGNRRANAFRPRKELGRVVSS